jgi:hypothetical protein
VPFGSPELEAPFRDAGVFGDKFEGKPTEEKTDGVHPFMSLPVGTAIDGQLKLCKRAGSRVRELTGAVDESGEQDSRFGPEKTGFAKRLLRNGL